MMYSGKPWNLLPRLPLLVAKEQHLGTFYSGEAFWGKFFFDRWKSVDARPSSQYASIMGSEVTIEWLENQFLTLDLFNQNNETIFLVWQAENLSRNVKEYIKQELQKFSSSSLIFIFGREDVLRKNLLQEHQLFHIQFDEVKFWEIGNLLHFLSNVLDLKLRTEAHEKILECTPHHVIDLYQALQNIKIFVGPEYNNPITVEIVQEILPALRVDQFALALLFQQKKFYLFVRTLLKVSTDFESLRLFFLFMQTHVMKLGDPRFCLDKVKKTVYEQQILDDAKKWSSLEISKAVRLFADLEILAKQKDFSLHRILQKFSLEVQIT